MYLAGSCVKRKEEIVGVEEGSAQGPSEKKKRKNRSAQRVHSFCARGLINPA
jgi:hypothetical protein